MRRQSGRRDGCHFRQGRAVPGIRRYLLCLHNDSSDTDSDSIPLSSLFDDARHDMEAVDYCSSLLTPMYNFVGNINPSFCSGLMQVTQAMLLIAFDVNSHSN